MCIARNKEPSQRLLRRLLNFDGKTGEWTWRKRPAWMFSPGRYGRAVEANRWNKRLAGKAALGASRDGYYTGAIFDRLYGAHRLAWIYENGPIPKGLVIDHVNGNGLDNRIENLEVKSQTKNCRNAKRSKRNKSGVTGVLWHSKRKHWIAQIVVDRKQIHLGSFTSKSDAAKARKAAEQKYGFHEHHGRS